MEHITISYNYGFQIYVNDRQQQQQNKIKTTKNILARRFLSSIYNKIEEKRETLGL